MAKEKAKDKGGTLNGKSKVSNDNRGSNGKVSDSSNTTNRALKNTGHESTDADW